MAARSGMTTLVNHLRQQGEAATTDVFNGVTYWTDDQLQDILDVHHAGKQTLRLKKVGIYDNVTYSLDLKLPYWVEGGFSIFVGDTTVEETTTYTYNHLTHMLTFDSDVADRLLYAFADVYIMTDAIADLWNQKAQHRKDYIVFKAGSRRMEGDQVYEHCLRQSAYWRNLIVRSFKHQSRRFV